MKIQAELSCTSPRLATAVVFGVCELSRCGMLLEDVTLVTFDARVLHKL